MNNQQIGKKISELRIERRMSQGDLAMYMNMSVGIIAKYETGEKEAEKEVLEKMARFFGVSLSYFYDSDSKPKVEKGEAKTADDDIGAKIVALRKARGITQAGLGKMLNISYQAVSKWERGESCPDFYTLSKLAQFFEVPISYFEKGNTQPQLLTEKATGRREMLGVCKDCGQTVYEDTLGSRTPIILCKDCLEKRKIAEKQRAAQKIQEEKRKKQEEEYKRAAKREEVHKARNKGLIWSGVIVGILLTASIIGFFKMSKEELAAAIPFTLVGTIFLYTWIAQLFWDGAILDCTLLFAKWVGMPGVIFTLDLDGILFLIGAKLLFAVLRFLIFLLGVLLGVFVAMLISPFTFVPALLRMNRENGLD